MKCRRMINLIKITLAYMLIVVFFEGCASAPSEQKPEPMVQKSEPMVIIPDPIPEIPPKPPEPIVITSVTYDRNEMNIFWQPSLDTNFQSYTLLQLDSALNIKDTITTIDDISKNKYSIYSFDPKIENWFMMRVTNKSGLYTDGLKKTHSLETEPPKASKLHKKKGRYDLEIRWTENLDKDFFQYNLYRSKRTDMLEKELVKTIIVSKDTAEILAMDSVYFYQIGVEDVWGLESFSNIVEGDYYIEILGERYSIVKTKEIDFSSKKIFDKAPREISQLINLEKLFLQNNYLTGDLPDFLWELKNLKVLNLSNNQFSCQIPGEIHLLQLLEELWISNNKIYGDVPHQVFSLKHLTHLNLSSNDISGSLSEAVGYLNSLKYLNLYDNRLTGFIPVELGGLPNLEFLSLGNNWINGTIPIELADAKNLKSLGLFNNQLTGKIPIQITDLDNLEYLSLFGNQLIGEVPSELFTDLNLSYLRLNDNFFNEVDLTSICKSGYDWDYTMYFDLSNNQFKEELPVCFSEPTFFDLYKSFNKK